MQRETFRTGSGGRTARRRPGELAGHWGVSDHNHPVAGSCPRPNATWRAAHTHFPRTRTESAASRRLLPARLPADEVTLVRRPHPLGSEARKAALARARPWAALLGWAGLGCSQGRARLTGSRVSELRWAWPRCPESRARPRPASAHARPRQPGARFPIGIGCGNLPGCWVFLVWSVLVLFCLMIQMELCHAAEW